MASIKEEEMAAKTDCQYVRALDANGNSIRISKEDLAKVLGELIGIASDEKDGLLQAGTFRYRGHQGDNGLDNIGSGYGYSYASDGSGVWGVFLSFNSDCRLQFKCSHADGSLYTRTYNQMTKEWSKWRLL